MDEGKINLSEELNQLGDDANESGIFTNSKLPIFIGAFCGFSVFLHEVTNMENVFTRPNSEGKRVFTLDGFIEYMKAPLMVGTEKFKTVWGLTPGLDIKNRLKMLRLNWIATTGVGIGVGIVVVYGIGKVFQ